MAEPSPTGRHGRLCRLPAGLLVLFSLGVLLRAGLLTRHGLWVDEFFSLAMATGHSLEHAAALADAEQGDYVETAQAVVPASYARYLEHDAAPAGPARVLRAVLLSDTSPPLYYLLLWAWTRLLGTSDVALRLFSLAFALACYPLVWSLARRFGGLAARLPACALFTLAPVSVFYATEGRMYSLLWFWTLCTMDLTLRLQARGLGKGRLLLWAAVSAAGLLTHYFYVFPWTAAVAWLFFHPRRLPRVVLIAGCLLTALLVLPWFVRLPQSLANWRVTGTWLNLEPGEFSFLYAWLKLPWSFVTARTVPGVQATFDVLNITAYALLALLAWPRLARSLFRPRRQLLWLWLAAPFAGIVLFDLVRQTYVVSVPRYALAGMPAAHLLVGLALGRLSPGPRVGLLVLVTTACLGGVYGIYVSPSRHYAQFREIGRDLARRAGPEDVVIVHSVPSGVAGVARHLCAERAPGRPGPGFASWVGQLGRRRVPDDVARLAAGCRRVFLVKVHEVGDPAHEVTWLRAHAVLSHRTRLEVAEVLTFVPAEGETFTFGSLKGSDSSGGRVAPRH